jgi:hypothetical protein
MVVPDLLGQLVDFRLLNRNEKREGRPHIAALGPCSLVRGDPE